MVTWRAWYYGVILALPALSCSLFLVSIASLLPSYPLLISASLAAAPLLTAAPSSLIVMPLADRFGRRAVLLVGMAVVVMGAGVCGFGGVHWAVMVAGRVVGGSGFGAVLLCRLYGEELVYERRVLSLLDIFYSIGVLLALLVCSVTMRIGRAGLAPAAALIPSLLTFTLVLVCLPESPVWLSQAAGGDTEEALQIVEKTLGNGQEWLARQQRSPPETVEPWSDLHKPKYRRPLIVSVLMAATVQIGMIYHHLLYSLLPSSSNLDIALVLGVGLPLVLCSVIYNTVICRVKCDNRRVLLVSLVSHSVCLLLMAVSTFYYTAKSKTIILVLVVLSIGLSSSTALIVSQSTNLHINSLLHADIHTRGLAFSHAASSLSSALVTTILVLFVRRVQWGWAAANGISAMVLLLVAVGVRTASKSANMEEQVELVHRLSVRAADDEELSSVGENKLRTVKTPKPPPSP